MDKDVQTRLATIEEKLDRLIAAQKPREYTVDFGSVQVDVDEIRRRLNVVCTNPPIRGD